VLANDLLIAIDCDILSLKEAIEMSRTSTVFTRIEPEIKEQAELVLSKLGISMSNAVNMFLRQIVLQKGIPFELKLPAGEPIAYGSLTKEQFDKEIMKGIEDINKGRVFTAEEVESEMKRDYGI
jgi:addiction module RelB/DinJ family antitoxin